MWLFTRHGFYSIVEKPAGTICVRSRCQEDLDNLQRMARIGPADVQVDAGTDYEYRFMCSRSDLGRIMSALADDIDYSNFKASIDDRHRESLYHQIWALVAQAFRRQYE